jgi:hypothetical protein
MAFSCPSAGSRVCSSMQHRCLVLLYPYCLGLSRRTGAPMVAIERGSAELVNQQHVIVERRRTMGKYDGCSPLPPSPAEMTHLLLVTCPTVALPADPRCLS